ncbi:MAG: 3-isopropylmalate dehydratase small subunit [candidate division NC10 bacterium]|nr:3-isopropylmalate dehydratase small subunit [candidate division NC10 bacterium]
MTGAVLKGKAITYGDDVNTDVIIPARYCTSFRAEELAQHCMEDLDPDFLQKRRPGDIIVAGNNFGCGSSRENAPLAIQGAGIACVIARSFGRIFYRNSINIGLPILESPEAAQAIAERHEIEVDLGAGRIRNLTTGASFTAQPFPEGIRAIMAAGGMVGFVRARLGVDAPAQPGRGSKRSQG